MITRSQRHRASAAALARFLLQAAGLTAAALAASACGGVVVVDEETDGSSGESTSSGDPPGEFTCEVPTTYGLEYVCITGYTPTQGCPPPQDPYAFQEIVAILYNQGCGGADVAAIPCGPDPTRSDQCCYYADAVIYQCGGRPFTVEGAARTAGAAHRADWMEGAAPDARPLDAASRAALAAAWTRSALDEHASVASFARFALELLAAGAPAHLVAGAQRAMGDEIRHAALAFGLASAYAGRDLGPGPLELDGALGGRASLAELAAAVVREGCVGETLAAFEAAAARDAATDPEVRAALEIIARDEADHAALAYRCVSWALAAGGAPVREAVREAVAAAFAEARCSLPAPPPHPGGDPAQLRAHGQLPPAERREAALACLAEVVAPCAQALLSAPASSGAADPPAATSRL